MTPILEQVIAAARAVGREEVMPRYLKVAHRKDDGSLFTEADLAAQHALEARLKAIVDCPVLGEEMTEADQSRLWQEGREGLWCVDPIDGTTNFVSGLPFFALSIALLRQGRPVLGVVYDPQADECFYAEAGGGAFVDGDSLPLKTPPKKLGRCIAGVDFKRIPRSLAGRMAKNGLATLSFMATATFPALNAVLSPIGRLTNDIYLQIGLVTLLGLAGRTRS